MSKLTTISLVFLVAIGCKKSASDQPAPEPAKPAASAQEPKAAEPAKPATVKPAEPAPPPSPPPAQAAKKPHAPVAAYKDVPAKPVTAKVGQLAWVIHTDAFDSADTTRVTVDEVTAIDGNTATTRELSLIASGADAWKHKPQPSAESYAGIPSLLVIPAHTVDEVKPKVGDIVFAYMGNTPTPHVAKVKAVDGGVVTYEVPDAMGKTLEEKKTDLIEPYGKGLAPFTFATYKDGADQKLITVLALAGDKVYGYDAGGKLVTIAKSKVKALKLEPKSRKVGDKVYAFPHGTGKADVIKTVKIPDQAYEVGYSLTSWPYVFDKLP